MAYIDNANGQPKVAWASINSNTYTAENANHTQQQTETQII